MHDQTNGVRMPDLLVDNDVQVGWNTRLVDGAWVPTFPNARYLFVETEHEQWKTAESLFEGDDVFGDSVAPISEAGQADLVEADHRVCDQVSFQPTPGHTPGSQCFLIGDRLVAGDTLFVRGCGRGLAQP